ncbi:hypothetical protein XELAEV_18033630mg [Xenopus laevis]|uniref:CCHC-type domain-containing protein n=1 Tax=Xenopus laevis TaxID=8355 RepID=A0A974HE72_XENLA|nr:hypothetical protein XELAEV_18033630mg [Xenopus laevis]
MGKKEIMPASRSVKTRLGSSRRATDPNIEVTMERTTKGKFSCSIKGKKKKSKSCSRSGMESDSDSVELESGVGVTAGSCGATTEASQEERVESDGCKMAADSEEPRSSVALEVAESSLTNQEMATDNMEPECSMAPEIAESALGDLEMATASEEPGNRVALDTEQVMTVTPMGKAVSEGNVHKVSETVIQYDIIIKALKDLRCLEDKQNCLNRDIDNLIDELQSLKGERRNQVILELTFLDKELKETETYIKDILNGSKTFAECSSATDIAQCNSVENNTDNQTDNVCAAAVSAGGSVVQAAEVQLNAVNAMHVIACVSDEADLAEGGGGVSAMNAVSAGGSVEQVAERGAAEVHVVDAIQVSGGREGKNGVYSAGESNVQGLEEFWRRYHLKKEAKEWEGFRVIPVSKSETKVVTIMMKNETVHEKNVLIWLRRQCTVLSPLVRLFDEEGFWMGGYKVQVKLHVEHNVQSHLPNSFFIGKTRGVCFYVGQPRLCYKCGSNRHYAMKCNVQKCALCGETGHPSKECVQAIKSCPNLAQEMSTPMPGENLPQTETRREERPEGVRVTARGRQTEVKGKVAEKDGRKSDTGKSEGNKKTKVLMSHEKGSGRDEWKVVSSKSKKKVKENKCPVVITIETENRFVLPGGKSWGELVEEEEARIEESPEKSISLLSVISSRKKSKREEISESQEADWVSLEEEEEEEGGRRDCEP